MGKVRIYPDTIASLSINLLGLFYGGVVQLVETSGLSPVQCEFESHCPYLESMLTAQQPVLKTGIRLMDGGSTPLLSATEGKAAGGCACLLNNVYQ